MECTCVLDLTRLTLQHTLHESPLLANPEQDRSVSPPPTTGVSHVLLEKGDGQLLTLPMIALEHVVLESPLLVQHDDIIRNIANLTLGGEAAAKTHVVTRHQQRQNEAKLANSKAHSNI
jgi:hypothetical protein